MLERLKQLVQDDAAIRRVRRMQPAGGAGDKIAPPTYLSERRGEGSRHAFEHRRVGDAQVLSVLLDSVASQANRLEEALKDTLAKHNESVPTIAVDFTGRSIALSIEGDSKNSKVVVGKGEPFDLSDLGMLTSLDVPHRVFDALFRDSQLVEDGKPVPFRDSKVFARLRTARPQNATELFGISPTALLFGAWDSTGTGGGLGAKFARSITSEVVGFNVAGEPHRVNDSEVEYRPDGKRVGSRLDPIGIRRDARVVGGAGDWQIATGAEKGQLKPSEVNHSNIPPTITTAGVSVDFVRHTVVLSFASLRRLRFPGTSSDAAGHAVLAALGLLAVLAQDHVGYALRSRCDLVPDGPATFELVHSDGTTEPFELDLPGAMQLYRDTVEAARASNYPWSKNPLMLAPQEKLVQLIALSRARALEGETEGDAE